LINYIKGTCISFALGLLLLPWGPEALARPVKVRIRLEEIQEDAEARIKMTAARVIEKTLERGLIESLQQYSQTGRRLDGFLLLGAEISQRLFQTVLVEGISGVEEVSAVSEIPFPISLVLSAPDAMQILDALLGYTRPDIQRHLVELVQKKNTDILTSLKRDLTFRIVLANVARQLAPGFLRRIKDNPVAKEYFQAQFSLSLARLAPNACDFVF
jgi:hypothetical protein